MRTNHPRAGHANYAADVLSDTKCILYKCVAKSVNFNIDAHPAATYGRTNVADIAQLYYNTYARLGYV